MSASTFCARAWTCRKFADRHSGCRQRGFLRSETSLIQTIGRAARNANGVVLMYADEVTPSMERAIMETERRRAIQDAYNKEHRINTKN